MATDEIDDVDGDLDLDLDNGLKKSASLLDFKHTGREIEEDRHHYFNTDPSPRSLKKALSFSYRRGLTSGSGDDSGDGSDLMEKDIIFKKPIHKRSILRKNSLPTVSSPDTVELNSQRASLNLSQKEREREIPSGNLSDLVGQVLVKIISAKDLPKKASGSSIYCEISLAGKYARTAILSKQTIPVWNETLALFVDELHVGGDLCIDIFSDDLLGRERLDGCIINLFQVDELQLTDDWYSLQNDGAIRVRVLFRRLRETAKALDKDLYGFQIDSAIQGDYWDNLKGYYKKLDERRKEWNKSSWWKFKDVKEYRSFARKGFPVEHRGEIWQIVSGSKAKLKSNSDYYFITLEQHKQDKTIHSTQIDKDLDRTFPHSILFKTTEGKDTLRRVLRAFSWKNQSIGYCQSMNFICGLLLLLMDEEAAFWCLATIVEDLVPDYFDMNMIGAKADVSVFVSLAQKIFPKVMSHFEKLEYDLSVSATPWFLCLFAGHLPTETLLRVFDVFLMEGSRVLHQVGLGLIKLNEQAILACQSLEDCFMLMKSLPSRMVDADKLIKISLKEIQIQPKAKLRSLKLSHCKQFEEIKRQNVFAELKQSTEYSEKELESLSRQYNAMVQITPDNQNLLMNFETFHQVIMSLARKNIQDEEKEEHMTTTLGYIFNATDHNGDSNIDFKEFILAMHVLRRGSHADKIQLAFLAFDKNKSHSLMREDVAHMIEAMEHTLPIDDDLRESIYAELFQGNEERVDFSSFKDRVSSVPVLESWLLELTTIAE